MKRGIEQAMRAREREREVGARGGGRGGRERRTEGEKVEEEGAREVGASEGERAREGVRSANGGECKLETLGQKAGGRGPG